VALVAIAVALCWGGEVLILWMDRCIVGFFSAAGNLKQFRGEDLLELSMQAGRLFVPRSFNLFRWRCAGRSGVGISTNWFYSGTEIFPATSNRQT
jgi:hypothetical protein